MDIDKLKERLRPWMRAQTWESGHPCDEQRFHSALHAAFSDLGPAIHAEDFEQAMVELLNELYPPTKPVDRSERVRGFVLKAEQISSYLYDTKDL